MLFVRFHKKIFYDYFCDKCSYFNPITSDTFVALIQRSFKKMITSRFSKDFMLVAIGQIISLFGNQILRFVLPLYLLNQTGSAALFGTIMAISFIPMILFFPIGGIIADRVNKRNIMVILDFCTAILILLFCLLTESIDIVSLVAITMIILCGIQGAYQPAVKASIPVLVKTDRKSVV